MKQRKGYYVWLLMVLVISLIASGCGNSNAPDVSDSNKDKGEATNSGSGAAAEQKLDPYKIVLVLPGSQPKDEQLVLDKVNAILEEKINAKLEIRSIDWSAWGDKTNLMFTSNEAFDLIFSAGWNGFSQQVGKGQFIPLDDLVKEYGGAFLSTIDPEIVNAAKVDGKLYGMVANKEFAADKGLILRKDLVDKYQFDLSKVKELADLEPLLKTIKDNEPGVTPFIVNGGLPRPRPYLITVTTTCLATVPASLSAPAKG